MKKTILFLFLYVIINSAFAQGAFDKLTNLGIKNLPDLNNILKGKEPVTSSLDDAVYEVPDMDNFEPAVILPANELPRNSDGSFYLFPGVWEFHLKSYCMKAGTYGPSKTSGSGHTYAPLLGPKADIIQSLLKNGFKHPEIKQREIQVLIWAIIARQNLKDMPKEYMLTAALLLDTKQLVRLNEGVVRNFAQKEFLKATDNLPEPARKVLEAENKMRGMLTDANTKYEDLERVAVLNGVMPENGGRKVKRGRWSFTPEGFYIRYFADSYKKMTLQVYVKESGYLGNDFFQLKNKSGLSGSTTGNLKIPFVKLKEFDPSKHPGMPPGGGQRLGPSNDKNNDPESRNDALDKANKILSGADNAQSALGMATDPLGTIMDKVNPFSPGNMFSQILNFITDNGRKISNALNGDPPDADYTSFAMAESFDYKSLHQTPFKNAALNSLSADFTEAYLTAHSYMLALVKSNDKQGGAKLANDGYWANLQAQAIIFYKKKVGDALLVACKKWEIFLKAIQAQAQAPLILKSSNITAYQQKLRTAGFDSSELAAFKFLRMSDADIANLKTERLAYDANKCTGNYVEQSELVLNAWKQYGNVYSTFPAIPAPWQ